MKKLYIRHTCKDGSTALRRLTPSALRKAQECAWERRAKVEQISQETARIEKFDAHWDY